MFDVNEGKNMVMESRNHSANSAWKGKEMIRGNRIRSMVEGSLPRKRNTEDAVGIVTTQNKGTQGKHMSRAEDKILQPPSGAGARTEVLKMSGKTLL
jgi:hypothetical protein